MYNTSGIVLAGGKGTRLDPCTPKPLTVLGDKTFLDWTLEKLDCLPLLQTIVVVGWKGEEIINKSRRTGIEWTIQPKQLGNADALGYGLSKLRPEVNTVFVIQVDDSAFYKPETLIEFINFHKSRESTISLMTVEKTDETRLHRTVNIDGYYCGEVALTTDEKFGKIPVEFFTGCACFEKDWLLRRLSNIPYSSKGEISTPTLFDMAKQEKERVLIYKLRDSREWVGINTPEQLHAAEKLIRSRETYG